MNTRNTPLTARSIGVVHRSTRHSFEAGPSTDAQPRTVLHMTCMELRWVAGEMRVRFSEHKLDVPVGRGATPRRGTR